jgi:XTP/dITP diphosphohydrolase
MRRFTGTELLVATHNQGKLEEIAHLLEPFGISVTVGQGARAAGAGGNRHDLRRERPDQGTCRGQATGLPALSDDSGIEIDALDGAPGVYTADWAETPSGRDFVMAMTRAHDALEAAKNAPEPRTARFCCTLVLAWPDGHDEVFPGHGRGRIVWPMRGEEGHGYDPIFQPDGHDITFGEMDRWEKNRISHRADAFAKLVKIFGPA